MSYLPSEYMTILHRTEITELRLDEHVRRFVHVIKRIRALEQGAAGEHRPKRSGADGDQAPGDGPGIHVGAARRGESVDAGPNANPNEQPAAPPSLIQYEIAAGARLSVDAMLRELRAYRDQDCRVRMQIGAHVDAKDCIGCGCMMEDSGVLVKNKLRQMDMLRESWQANAESSDAKCEAAIKDLAEAQKMASESIPRVAQNQAAIKIGVQPHSVDPCQFCGSALIHVVECGAVNCKACGPSATCSADAVRLWNTRHLK